MKILVTGSGGMLGSSVKREFEGHNLILTNSIDLDVRNIVQVMSFADKQIDLILHLAAETDLIKSEFSPSDAYFTNFVGTKNVLELAKLLNIPIVYMSTAGVFDGTKEVYTEKDKPNPLHHYGRSKYYGECIVKRYEKHYILRGGWGMGGGPKKDKKFINKVFNQINLGKTTLYGVIDIYGNPTYSKDLAMTILNIAIKRPEYGIYHTTGKGVASRFNVLKCFVEFMDLEGKVEVIPVTAEEYYDLFPVQFTRSKSEVLSIDKLEKTGLSAMRDWQVALNHYLKEFIHETD